MGSRVRSVGVRPPGGSLFFFEKNLEILQKLDPQLARAVAACTPSPDLEVATAKSGEKVPVVDGRALHSTYRPAEEGSRFIAAQSLDSCRAAVVLGLGFGYHLDSLLQRSIPVVVVERRLDILRAAMQARDLERILSNVTLLCGAPPASVATVDAVAEAALSGALGVISHEPSVRLAAEYYAAVQASLQRPFPDAKADRLRILVVSPAFGGSLPVARHASKGLEENGCETLFLDMSPFSSASRYIHDSLMNTTVQAGMEGLFERFLCEFVYWKVKQLQPELTFFIAQAPVSPELLKKLQNENFRTAFWFVENYKLFPYWKEIAPHCDYFFTIQRNGFFSQLDELRAFNHFYLPVACDPGIHRPEKLSPEDAARYGSRISMAGFGYFNRLMVLQGLTDYSLKLWGPGWDRCRELARFIQCGTEFDTETAVKIYNASEINLNLHSSTHAAGVEPAGDFVNPRTFELAACRAFQLTDERAELAELFSIGNEIITFRDVADLREKIEYYLSHPALRQDVAERARVRALADHTYAVRMRQMLRSIYPAKWLQRRTTRAEDPDLREQLLRDMPQDHELLPVVKACEGERVTIDCLIERLVRNPGRPGPQEIALRWISHTLSQGLRQ